MNAAITALCLLIWSLLSPGLERSGNAREVSNAIASAVVADAANAPALTSHDEDAAALAYLAARESALRVRAVGDGGRAHGVFQLHGPCGRRSLAEQARCELSMLHEGAKRCPGNALAILWGSCHMPDPLTGRDVSELAAMRESRTRRLLERAIAQGVAEAQAP